MRSISVAEINPKFLCRHGMGVDFVSRSLDLRVAGRQRRTLAREKKEMVMPETFGEQTRIRCVQLRGGTSKGLYFHEADLPKQGPSRDRLLLRLMGSPDVLEIDGLGGSRPITSKVAIVSKSKRQDADVDYTFAKSRSIPAG